MGKEWNPNRPNNGNGLVTVPVRLICASLATKTKFWAAAFTGRSPALETVANFSAPPLWCYLEGIEEEAPRQEIEGLQMQLAELVLRGTVTDLVERSGVKDGNTWRMVTAFIPGRRTVYAVTLADDLIPKVGQGQEVELVVSAKVYNSRIDYTAWELLEDETSGARSLSA